MVEILSLVVALVSALLAYFALPEPTRQRLLQRVRGAPEEDKPSLAEIVIHELQPTQHDVDAVRDTYELRQLWQIDNDSYQDFSIDFDTFVSWWRAFPSGLVAARDSGGEIIGGIGTWPVPRRWTERLTNDCNPESLISEDSIRACLSSRGRPDWYISGIVLSNFKSNFSGKRMLPLMFQRAVLQISMHPRFHLNSTLYAMPISEEGARLLRRFHFTEYAGLACEPPLYYRQCSAEFLSLLNGLKPKES
ncbi:hypothetical protein [Brevundimonas sp.]|uniref:hypothetical protein n=1 Tax=Brevundimonas sp. TaxID=1871086 RepID=UPI0025F60A39|nr:hypothetical protein [Brevundimonas sp.]